MDKMSIQLFKDNDDLCVVFKNIDSTIEESLVKMFSSFLDTGVKEVPELVPVNEEEPLPPILNKENEIPIIEKPLFLQETENLLNSYEPIETINDFINNLSDKNRFDDLAKYYKTNKSMIEKLNISVDETKQMLNSIYVVCPDIIQKNMLEKSFNDYDSFVESCKSITIRKIIRASLSAYFKEFN